MTASIGSSDAPRAVTFGEALVVLVQSEPGPMERSATFRRGLGGAEANVALGLVACDIPTAMITRVGDDGFGRFIVGELGDLGVDTSAVTVDPHRKTGVYVKEVGGATTAETDLGAGASIMHYYRTGSAGASLSRTVLAHPEVRGVLTGVSLVHTSGITPALSQSAERAQRQLLDLVWPETLVAFDLNWRPALWRGREVKAPSILGRFMHTCDVALAGLKEAGQVFGTETPEDIRRMFPEPRRLVVKDDGGAVVAFDGDERVVVGAHPVEVVEATGAGDAFASGLLAGVLRDLSLRDSVELGHRSAGLVLTSTSDHVVPERGAVR
ncbi:MAG: sugar kinase [Propioniciclava sp.]